MKKHIYKFVFSLSVLFFASKANAQVTVTSTAGVPSATYTTLNDALNAINTGTHQDMVDINITANTTEPATPFPLVSSGTGSASYTLVIIRPTGDVTVNSAAAPTASRAMIEFLGADNVIIEGDDIGTAGTRNLTFSMVTSTTTGLGVVRFSSASALDGATNNTIRNCNIIGSRATSTSTTTNYGIYSGTSGTSNMTTSGQSDNNDNLTIENNLITRCYWGIYCAGTTTNYMDNLIIRNNVIGSSVAADAVANRGIYVQNTQAVASPGASVAIIEGNDIRLTTSTSSTTDITAIEIANGNCGIEVRKNNIHDVFQPNTGGYGAYGIWISGTTNNSAVHISNNFIRDITDITWGTTTDASDFNCGIFISVSAQGVRINHNSISLQAANGGSSAFHSACIYVSSGTATIAELQNNILVNTQGSGTGNFARGIFTSATVNISAGTINRNNYYTPGPSGYTGRYNALNQVTLIDWQTATTKDANSFSVNPPFVSSSDLHILAASATVLESGGTTLAFITNDIDNDSRPGPAGSVNGGGTNSDIGADEFDGVPATNCTGTPATSVTQSSSASVCSGVNFTLSLDINYTELGYTYQWQSSPDNVSYTNISGATLTTLITNQTAATYYQCIITCTNSGLSTTSTPVLVNLNAPTACYCNATFPSNVEPITLVDFAGINNTTSNVLNGTPALEDFTSITGNVMEGQTYPINLKGNTDGNFTSYLSVYIDFNQNGVLDDAGEIFNVGTITNSTGIDAVTLSGNITIPMGALAGNTRMRVVKKFNANGLPCNNAGYGQAEDYTLNITLAPTCSGTPTAGTISPASTGVCAGENITLNLNGNTADNNIVFQWESSTDGSTFTPITGANSTSYTTTINSEIYYQCVVTCTASGLSATTSEVHFTINPFTSCYCVTSYPSAVEPITLVDFAGINNTTSNVVGGSPAQENFQSIVAVAERGHTYPISLKGNTDGNFANYLQVFIDFNQNGSYADPGETFNIGTITNSTGIDAITLTGNITIPITANLGITGLRVVKKFGSNGGPCNTSGFGQTEDYLIDIQPCTPPSLISLTSNDADAIICNGATVLFTADAGYSYYDFQVNTVSVQTGTGNTYSNAALVNTDAVTVIAGYDVTCSTTSNTITFTVNGVPSASLSATQPACAGVENGAIDLSVTGGTSPFVYDWDNDGTGDNDDAEDLTSLPDGVFTVLVTDDNGCTATANTTLAYLTSVNVSVFPTDASCFGLSDGSIDITVSGGTSPYVFDWDNDGTGDNDDTEDLINIPAGTYIGIVYDANGCTDGGTVVISEPTQITVSSVLTTASCNGVADANADITVTGGAGGYTYDWSTDGLGDNDDAEDLTAAAGTYTLVVSDLGGCSAIESITLTEPDVITVSATATHISCNGLTDGSIDLTITGGTSPYVIDWDNDGTGDNDDAEDLSALSASTYNVVVTDDNGCPSANTSATINEPAIISITTVITNANCDNSTDGGIDVTVTGGTAPYSYNWSNSEITEDISGVAAGSYTIDVTDDNGCIESLTETIAFDNTAPTVTLTITPSVVCNTDGVVNLGGESPTGGVWSGTGVSGSTFNPATAGVNTHTITYTFTDVNGCSNSAQDDIVVDDCSGISENKNNLFSVYPNPTLGVITITSVANNGNLIIRDAVGRLVFSTVISSNSTTVDLSGFARGVYTISLETEKGNSVQKVIKD